MLTERTPTTKNRWLWIIPAALAVMVTNIAIHILYMVVYSYLINPGENAAYYKAHAELSAPYSSIVVGMPLMFIVSRWIGARFEARSCVTAALLVWLVYFLVDFSIVGFSGALGRVTILFAISFVTKLAAAYLGGLAARKQVTALSARHSV